MELIFHFLVRNNYSVDFSFCTSGMVYIADLCCWYIFKFSIEGFCRSSRVVASINLLDEEKRDLLDS